MKGYLFKISNSQDTRRLQRRHCERSEAIHCPAQRKEWIASSLRSSQ
jgi:hypothetical protein